MPKPETKVTQSMIDSVEYKLKQMTAKKPYSMDMVDQLLDQLIEYRLMLALGA